MKGDKEGHYIMIKGTIQEEDITITNIYAPNIGAPQYVRQMLRSMKGKINNNTIIVGDFNTPLTPMDRSTKQKINRETPGHSKHPLPTTQKKTLHMDITRWSTLKSD